MGYDIGEAFHLDRGGGNGLNFAVWLSGESGAVQIP